MTDRAGTAEEVLGTADQRREQMLRAALLVISERGYADTRIADVAERTGISPALVIYYFKTKDQLLTEAIRYYEDGWYAVGQRRMAGLPTAAQRLEEIVANVFEAGERVLIFTHFARWGEKLATYLTERTGRPVPCYHGGLSRTVRDNMVHEFQTGTGPAALVLSLKAGGAGLNLTAASHVVLYDRWWNPAVEDQARDRAWRIGQTRTVISHRLVCPGTIDERVEEVVAGKRHIANLVLPARSTLGDLGRDQLRAALGLSEDVLVDDDRDDDDEAAA